MEVTIGSDDLTVKISSKGAELLSIRSKSGTEYLWQGDPAYWTSHAPNIFPYVARLTEGKYTLDGKSYGFGNHGLVRYVDLKVEEQSESRVVFRMDSDEESREKYPFDFCYRMIYSVEGNTLRMETVVDNLGEKRMYFAVGGHPGFNVPMEEGSVFEDYRIEFSTDAHPYRIILADSGAVTPGQELYELKDRSIKLRHDLFDHDAIVLVNAAREAAICSDKTNRRITVSYPDFRYIGFWHKPCTDAPYLCVEPWTSLPSREGIIEDFALQGDLISLEGGKEWRTVWTVRIDE